MEVNTIIIGGGWLKDMCSENTNPSFSELSIAGTLLARDYKGVNNYGLNSVLVQITPPVSEGAWDKCQR